MKDQKPSREDPGTLGAPDLEIAVNLRIEASGTHLDYGVRSPSGLLPYAGELIHGPRLTASPEGFRDDLMARLEDLATWDLGAVEEELRRLGRDLYQQLFPPQLRRVYRHVRHRARSVAFVSREPWIPWEMVWPYDDSVGYDRIDDGFLCEKFVLTRWLPGAAEAPVEILVRALACLEGQYPSGAAGVWGAEGEGDLLRRLAGKAGIEDHSMAGATLDAVRLLLADVDLDLIHFAGHGIARPKSPDESLFALAENRYLRPRDLVGPPATRIKGRRPLVFLNSCQAASQSWSLTGLGGWVARFVGDGRCGAFVGPLWSVDQESARRFATTFYSGLAEGMALGEAISKARRETRDARPDSPDWLAFAAYGHPATQVIFESRPAEATD